MANCEPTIGLLIPIVRPQSGSLACNGVLFRITRLRAFTAPAGCAPAAFHFELGGKLAPLREEGVLIVRSDNLHTYAWGRHMPDPYDWASASSRTRGRFAAAVRNRDPAGRRRRYVSVEGVDGGSISMLAVQVGVS